MDKLGINIRGCMCLPPQQMPPSSRASPNTGPSKLTLTLNPHPSDKQASFCFLLVFRCVINICVRGSEPIGTDVVQAGMPDVVGYVLEA
jgi:hypothetical protein